MDVGMITPLAAGGPGTAHGDDGEADGATPGSKGPGSVSLVTVLDNLTDGVAMLDLDRNLVQMNRAAAELLGLEQRRYGAEELSGLFGVRSLDGAEIPNQSWPTVYALRGEYLKEHEFQLVNAKTGVPTHTLITTAPIHNRAGELVRIMVVYRDVTVQRQLDQMRNRLVAIVESSEDAIIGKDDTRVVTSWNRGAQKIFGYTAEEMIGRSIKILLPLGQEAEEDRILARIKRGETVDHMEATRRRKDGAEIVVSLTISPIRDASGRIVGASKVARDITEQRRMERQIQQSHRMEAIGQLTGGIAHDFNNLLGVTIGNLDLLEEMIAGDAAASMRLHTARRAALRGADLTRRLLAFSSRQELHPVATPLDHSIRNTLELAQRGLGPEVRIVTQIEKHMPPVMVDPAGLETMLLNLFVNARDAMEEGGVLTVTTQSVSLDADYPPVRAGELGPGHYVCVTVTDTGHGMSAETLQRACEPFYTTKERGHGTGLGLPMAYGFARQSGGTLRIYSEVGYGTSVAFYLPVLASAVGEPKPEAAARDALQESDCTVLLVDDEEDLLELGAVYVEQMGCKVLKALNGASAVAILESSEKVDVMLTDIIMPGGMSGTALAERARALRPAMRIVYTSGFPLDALASRMSLKPDGLLLRKPYQRAGLQAAIREALKTDGGVA